MSSISSVGYFLVANLFSFAFFILWARLFIRYFSVGTFHPFSQSIYTLTAPIIAPIQKNITRNRGTQSRYDFACLILLVFCELFKFTTINVLFLSSSLSLNYVLMYSIVDMVVQPCNILFYAIIIRSLMSWLNPHWQHPFASLLFLVTEPSLRAIRRVLPNVGMIDLSPIVVILVLKSIEIVASSLLPQLSL